MPRPLSRLAFSTALAASIGAAHAQPQVTVQDAWVRATVPQQKATGAFMRLKAGQDTRLVSVSTPVAPIAEVHEMKMVDNVMKMRAVQGLDLPAGKGVDLQPGGYHVMLMDLPAPVRAGDVVPLTLVFEGKDGRRETVQVQAQARGMTNAAAAAGSAGAATPAGGTAAGHGDHGDHGAHKH